MRVKFGRENIQRREKRKGNTSLVALQEGRNSGTKQEGAAFPSCTGKKNMPIASTILMFHLPKISHADSNVQSQTYDQRLSLFRQKCFRNQILSID
jgi:hypothetical protein